MCYIIITGGSLIWFLLSLIADMLIASAIVTPKWLIGPAVHTVTTTRTRSIYMYTEEQQLQQQQQQQQQHSKSTLDYINVTAAATPTKLLTITTVTTTTTKTTAGAAATSTSTSTPTAAVAAATAAATTITPIPIPSHTITIRYPSVGIYTRCKIMKNIGFHCGPFDLDGFATDSLIYPTAWKAAMFFISFGFVLLTLTVLCTLWSCCRQSIFGKSLHNMTACAQVIAGICVMLSVFLHPLAWSAPRVQLLCGSDAEPFYAASCSIGISFYCAILGVTLCFICAGLSIKAESSNLRSRVKGRIESGERLVCIP